MKPLENKPFYKKTWFIVVIVLFVVLPLFQGLVKKAIPERQLSKQQKDSIAIKIRIDSVAKERTERKEKIGKLFGYDGGHRGFEKILKEGMNDPDSYEHVQTVYTDRGNKLEVTTKYRGKNKFGGVITEIKKFDIDLSGNILNIYN